MKKGKLFFCLLMVVLLGGMWLSPGVAKAQTIELTFNHLITRPSTFATSMCLNPGSR